MEKVAELNGHTARVLQLALSPDKSTLLSAGADETLRLWNCFPLDTKKEVVKQKQTHSALRMTIRWNNSHRVNNLHTIQFANSTMCLLHTKLWSSLHVSNPSSLNSHRVTSLNGNKQYSWGENWSIYFFRSCVISSIVWSPYLLCWDDRLLVVQCT